MVAHKKFPIQMAKDFNADFKSHLHHRTIVGLIFMTLDPAASDVIPVSLTGSGCCVLLQIKLGKKRKKQQSSTIFFLYFVFQNAHRESQAENVDCPLFVFAHSQDYTAKNQSTLFLTINVYDDNTEIWGLKTNF